MHPQRQAWLVLLVLIAAQAALVLFFNPVGADQDSISEQVALPLMGVVLAQPIAFATWAALGPGPAVMRIPLTLTASIAVSLASAIKQWNVFTHGKSFMTGEELVMDLALFGITLLIMLAARWIIGWRISQRLGTAANSSANQFSLKYLIVLTTICAGLLVVGRGVLANEHWAESAFWKEVVNGLMFVGLLLLILFPLLILPLMALAQHLSKRALAATPFLWAGLTWLTVEIQVAVYKEPRADLVRQLTLIQGGALVTTLLSAFALRYAGYRLVSSNRQSSPESVASA